MAKKQLNQNVLIELINLSAGTQQRQLSPDVVSHYQDLRKDGIELPPVELINDGKQQYLWDGFHRLAVAKNLGETHIRANVEIGNLRRAVFLSFSANSQHGFPRQPGAKQFIVDKMLKDKEWSKMGIAAIAAHVGCHRSFVYKRKNLISEPETCLPVDKSELHTGGKDAAHTAPPSPALTGSRTETGPRSPLHDGEGQVVPSALADRFLSRSVIKERINELDRIKNAVKNKIAEGDLTYCLLNQSGFEHDFNNFRARLKSAIPYAICPYCDGKGCGACHEMGLLNEMSWKAAPKNKSDFIFDAENQGVRVTV